MTAPHDTSTDHHLLKLLTASEPGGIERQERQGQAEVLRSTAIPRQLLSCTEGDLTALGFVLGEPTDDLFREATLPEGWSRKGSDHAMWSYIVDEHGRERAAIFYKAAFYDRDAHLSITSVFGYVGTCAREGTPAVYDDEWATPAAVSEAAEAGRARTAERLERYGKDDPEYAADLGREVAAYEAIASAARGA